MGRESKAARTSLSTPERAPDRLLARTSPHMLASLSIGTFWNRSVAHGSAAANQPRRLGSAGGVLGTTTLPWLGAQERAPRKVPDTLRPCRPSLCTQRACAPIRFRTNPRPRAQKYLPPTCRFQPGERTSQLERPCVTKQPSDLPFLFALPCTWARPDPCGTSAPRLLGSAYTRRRLDCRGPRDEGTWGDVGRPLPSQITTTSDWRPSARPAREEFFAAPLVRFEQTTQTSTEASRSSQPAGATEKIHLPTAFVSIILRFGFFEFVGHVACWPRGIHGMPSCQRQRAKGEGREAKERVCDSRRWDWAVG